MGQGLAAFYRNHVKNSWKTAFFSAIVFGLIAHLYKFTNYLPNHDALYCVFINPPNAIGSGRWLLDIACNLSSPFDAPWIRGLVSLLWIGLTAAVLVDFFEIRNRFLQLLTGGLLAVFPTVTNTFFFEFNADAYMLAMLFSALAMRLSRIGDTDRKHLAAAVLCICLCCGIYQAYLSFGLMLALSHLILSLLKGNNSRREYLRWFGRQLIVYGGGVALYLLIWKLCLVLGGGAVNPYQGMDGSISLSLSAAVKSSLRTISRFFLGGDVRKNGWTLYAGLNLVFLLGFLGSMGLAAGKSGIFRRKGACLLAAAALLLMPFAICMWYFLSPAVSYHMLMLQSLYLLYLLCAVLIETYGGSAWKRAASVFFLLLIWKFTLQANMCYFEMDLCEKRTEATATEILTRIHEQDDGSVRNIALIGGGDRSLVAEGATGIEEILVHAHQLRSNLIFDHNYATMYLTEVMGTSYTGVSAERILELENSDETADMPAWPLEGSVRIIGDTAVIRLPDPETADA